MEAVQHGRVLDRLRPFVRDDIVRRTRLERVLGTFGTNADGLRYEVERLLNERGIIIEEDDRVAEYGLADSAMGGLVGTDRNQVDDVRDLAPVQTDAAVAAARGRLERDRHVKDLAKVLLRAEEEVGLAILVRGERGEPLRQGDFARLSGEARSAAECLLLHNQGLARSVAKRFAPPGMTHEDLFHHGVIGLIRAVELYDPTRGLKFSTYAMHWVRQAITRGIANESRVIRLPVHMIERLQKVWATRTRLTVDGEPPTLHQLALACSLSDEQTTECLIIGPQDVVSLDLPVGPEGETTLADLIDASDPDHGPESEIECEFMKLQLKAVLETLTDREAGVISLRYGLTDGEKWTLDDIGQIYGLTRERIRQIENKTMGKLRRPSIIEVLEPYLYSGGVRPQPKEEADADLDSASGD